MLCILPYVREHGNLLISASAHLPAASWPSASATWPFFQQPWPHGIISWNLSCSYWRSVSPATAWRWLARYQPHAPAWQLYTTCGQVVGGGGGQVASSHREEGRSLPMLILPACLPGGNNLPGGGDRRMQHFIQENTMEEQVEQIS